MDLVYPVLCRPVAFRSVLVRSGLVRGVLGRGVIALAAIVAVASLASPAAAFDCDDRLVLVGDRAHEVLSRCGEPASVARRTESRTDYQAVRGRPGVVGSSYTVTVEIEVWVYDFGPRRFMEELTFETGVLRSIRTLGYGTRAGARSERRTAIDRPGRLFAERAIVRRRRAG